MNYRNYSNTPYDMIVSVGVNWEIGENGGLAIQNPEDMRFFRTMTMGTTVIMGRKTAESLPHKKPLEGRINIVVSKKPGAADPLKKNGFKIADSIESACTMAQNVRSMLSRKERIMIIGGASIYQQCMKYCRFAYITKTYAANEYADTYFPVIDLHENYDVVMRSEKRKINGFPSHQFFVYQNKSLIKMKQLQMKAFHISKDDSIV